MQRVGVVGWPVEHSRSPVIFGHWFAVHGIDARYERIAVAPDEAAAFFADLASSPYTGVNVTMPYKALAAESVSADPVATRLGVANTIWRDGDGLSGSSSDGSGFIASLDDQAPDWRGAVGPAVIVGAGGASVAVADALVAEGCRVLVANRTADKAEAVAARAGAEAIALDALPDALSEASLLVNATSLGMDGTTLSVDPRPLPAGTTVADLIYNPLETPLLAAARARGLVPVDGLGMLLFQATTGFERWFGVKPKVDRDLRRLVSATL
ncbi:shikimate dehydrogenase family protein [Acuticoccus mangrovi]|uniref:Shikimate dehydrogenase (NADP(+)) n=1 Tax=Acuticoccus mangrovi TaxID=2796142 RepID=A0A934IJU4_9HYPH|nr:shikimate dehydrogenase [Acuticoccus mangrovi]MBJ3777813.1 shikimate dehydrogenase [Acuticoccus mangrovi]